MSGWPLVPLAVGLMLSALLGAAIVPRRLPERLLVPNHAGRPLPVVLGAVLVVSALTAFAAGMIAAGGRYRLQPWDVASLASVGALAVAGAMDDLGRRGPRGLGGHLRSLVRGRPTTGILKLTVAIAGAVAIAGLVGGSALRLAAGTVVIAASVNVWNALDVAPGRCLKWALLALAAVLAAVWDRTAALLLAGTLGASLALLPFDLGERAMLGDAGSNPLGLVVGVGLFLALSEAWLVVAAAALLLLQVAAETVTISRLIRATPPLAWLDDLGRR